MAERQVNQPRDDLTAADPSRFDRQVTAWAAQHRRQGHTEQANQVTAGMDRIRQELHQPDSGLVDSLTTIHVAAGSMLEAVRQVDPRQDVALGTTAQALRHHVATLAAGMPQTAAAMLLGLADQLEQQDHKAGTPSSTTTIALRGPWHAVLADGYGDLYESIDEFDDDQTIQIAVVRGSAAPAGTRLPGTYRSADVLYQLDDVDLADQDEGEIADRWEQAKAIAAALNGLDAAPAADPVYRLPNEPPGVLAEVAEERQRQDEKWGEQNHPDGTGGPVMQSRAEEARAQCQFLAANGGSDWRAILLEEVYEALAEEDPAALRTELIQVAAVAVQWVQAIDRRGALSTTPPAGTEGA